MNAYSVEFDIRIAEADTHSHGLTSQENRVVWKKLNLCSGLDRLLMASLLVLIFTSAFFQVQQCEACPTLQDTTDHLPAANLIFMDRKKGLQVITLPATDAMDPKIEIRSVGVKKPFGKPIGVYGAHLITLDGYGAFKQGLHATDLYDGTVRTLVEADVVRAAYSSEHLYYSHVRESRSNAEPGETDKRLCHTRVDCRSKVTR